MKFEELIPKVNRHENHKKGGYCRWCGIDFDGVSNRPCIERRPSDINDFPSEVVYFANKHNLRFCPDIELFIGHDIVPFVRFPETVIEDALNNNDND